MGGGSGWSTDAAAADAKKQGCHKENIEAARVKSKWEYGQLGCTEFEALADDCGGVGEDQPAPSSGNKSLDL